MTNEQPEFSRDLQSSGFASIRSTYLRIGVSYLILVAVLMSGSLFLVRSVSRVRVPSLIGVNYLDAYDMLNQVGLRVDLSITASGVITTTRATLNDQPQGSIIAESPKAHTPVMQGSVVRVVVLAAVGPQPIRIMPNIVGMRWGDAIHQLRSLGLWPYDTLAFRWTDSELPGIYGISRVAKQQVIAGSRIPCGSRIGVTPTKPSGRIPFHASRTIRQLLHRSFTLALDLQSPFMLGSQNPKYPLKLIANETRVCRALNLQARKFRSQLNGRLASYSRACLDLMNSAPRWWFAITNGSAGAKTITMVIQFMNGGTEDMNQALSNDGYGS